MPGDDDIRNYFNAAERALRARGIRPLSKESRDKAETYVLEFNRNEGPAAYPRIVDTEHRLQKDKGKYILHGVVDVIAITSDIVSDWGIMRSGTTRDRGALMLKI